jgi:hypothetical protein
MHGHGIAGALWSAARRLIFVPGGIRATIATVAVAITFAGAVPRPSAAVESEACTVKIMEAIMASKSAEFVAHLRQTCPSATFGSAAKNVPLSAARSPPATTNTAPPNSPVRADDKHDSDTCFTGERDPPETRIDACARLIVAIKQAHPVPSGDVAVFLSSVFLQKAIIRIGDDNSRERIISDESNRRNLTISDLNEAILLNPSNYQAFLFRGTANISGKRFDQAVLDLSVVIQHMPQTPQQGLAYFARGTTYREQHQYQLALNDYNRALQFSTKFPGIREAIDQAQQNLKGNGNQPNPGLPPDTGSLAIVCVERSQHAQNTERISFDLGRKLVISHFGWLGDRGRNLPLRVNGSILSWTDSMDFPNEVDLDTRVMHRMLYGVVAATLDCR